MGAEEEKARILIVEDEVLIAADLEGRLTGLGYTVCGKATSGKEALDLAEQHCPDLVIMDIILQGKMDGTETAEVIRDKWGTPIVFLTAYADTDRLERAKLTYPFGYILKPFRGRDLKITIDMALYVAKADAERKKAEAALMEESIQRRLLVEGSRDGIVVLDQNGKVWEANQQYAQMLGYTDEELLELYVWDWDDQWTKEEILEMIRTVDEDGDHFVTRHRRKDGSLLDVEISTNGAMFPGRKLVFCVCRDITERRRTERELRENEARFRSTFENAPIGMAVIDPSGNFINTNPALQKMTGYQADELIQMGLAGISHPEDMAQGKQLFEKLVAGERDHCTVESRFLHKDGTMFRGELNLSVIRDNNSRPQSLVGLLMDVTDCNQNRSQKPA
jgi:PAS domain S-box-containing protein